MQNLNLISTTSPEFCCGTTCPRQEVQIRIDRMQAVIDQAHQLLNYGDVPKDIIAELKKELEILSSD